MSYFDKNLQQNFSFKSDPLIKKSYLLYNNVINSLKNENKYLNIDTQSFYI